MNFSAFAKIPREPNNVGRLMSELVNYCLLSVGRAAPTRGQIMIRQILITFCARV